MSSPMRKWSIVGAWAVGMLALALQSCQPVREERQITFSPDGQCVGFQHGHEGIFVADKNGDGLLKVFQPGAEVIAVSTPLWNPTDRRLIFTTARDSNGQTRPPFRNPLGDDPAGNLYEQHPITYTCYLRDEVADGKEAKVTRLFEAACDHTGYVAANLAVRWHPDGKRVLFLQQTSEVNHGLFEFDLLTQEKRLLFDKSAEALIFDFSGDGSHLYCVRGNLGADPRDNGVWITRIDENRWRHVPHSEQLAAAELPSLIEQLRASKPAFAPKGDRFAFAVSSPDRGDGRPRRHSLRVATVSKLETELVAEGARPYRELRWSPDGIQLGFVAGFEDSTLHIWQKEGGLSKAINAKPVRQFTGWNRDGSSLAYVARDEEPIPLQARWAFLLIRDGGARDRVYVADGKGTDSGQAVFSGMRVTFPQWSPLEDKLSLWFTFCPTHRSLVSLLLGLGLQPGDPAATFDVASGRIGWMAVNAHEKAQVGHYYLLKRDYAEALHWYHIAEKERPAARVAGLDALRRELINHRDFLFFHYYCLTKCGRHDEAKVKLAEFQSTFLNFEAAQPAENVGIFDHEVMRFIGGSPLWREFIRSLYVAEVFLSLDAFDDGIAYFQSTIKASGSNEVRLASAMALSQLLLVCGKDKDFAELCTNTILPLLIQVKHSVEPESVQGLLSPFLWNYFAGLQLLPMFSTEFLEQLPPEYVATLIERWTDLQKQVEDNTHALAIDLFLRAAYERLGKHKKTNEVMQRLKANPEHRRWIGNEAIGDIVKRMQRRFQ